MRNIKKWVNSKNAGLYQILTDWNKLYVIGKMCFTKPYLSLEATEQQTFNFCFSMSHYQRVSFIFDPVVVDRKEKSCAFSVTSNWEKKMFLDFSIFRVMIAIFLVDDAMQNPTQEDVAIILEIISLARVLPRKLNLTVVRQFCESHSSRGPCFHWQK